ncbi:MAG: hypothetical protein PHY09_07935 [Desulfuromonadaceae bacterium]|nr:hypothetical protein [Desulfuromonadaceae bacterium]MDD5106600.1 hypothetical protein [Desulfuromonadaceae bacterium]
MMYRTAGQIGFWACILLLSACSSPAVVTRVPWIQEKEFAEALTLLRTGKEKQARTVFEQVIVAPSLPGLTEEALFRLAILRLSDGGEKGVVESQALVERLVREYPDTLWARQAAPLVSHLSEMRQLYGKAGQLTKLHEQNMSLNHDIEKLRQNLERIKKLDLELDK